MVDSPWLSVITNYLNDPSNAMKDITTELLLSEAVEKPIERQTKSDIMTVSSILRSLQYERKENAYREHPNGYGSHLFSHLFSPLGTLKIPAITILYIYVLYVLYVLYIYIIIDNIGGYIGLGKS